MKKVLMIAFHFPPLAGSSGIQRTLRFAKYLPEFGWEPIVLTAHPRAYERTSQDQISDIPPGVTVIRAEAFDAARHFSVLHRYPGALARPDRWISWLPGAVLSGLNAIRKHKPDVIWSTYPIATAHRIGATLNKLTGLPWMADFRDPMAQDGYPEDPKTWLAYKQIEEHAAWHAAACTFTTPGTVRTYSERYPWSKERFMLIENGYDEESFSNQSTAADPLNPGKFTLLHSGIVYPKERDPTQLFLALRDLKESSAALADRIRLRFRASAHEEMLRRLVAVNCLESQVEILPPVGYREALNEMMRADALLILQAANCNDQIPAKLYEYLRTGRPIVALADPSGDTARTLTDAGVAAVAPLDQCQPILRLLEQVILQTDMGTTPNPEYVLKCSRKGRTDQFAAVLNKVSSQAEIN